MCLFYVYISIIFLFRLCYVYIVFILCLDCVYIMFMGLCMFMEEGASQRVISEEGGRAAT